MNHHQRRGRGWRRALVSLFAAPLLCRLLLVPIAADPPARASNWPVAPLWSSQENRDLAQLALRISGGPTSPADTPAALRREIRQLPIREAAVLGTILMDDHDLDPRPWLELPHAREREATARVKKLQERFGYQEPRYPVLETTVRGPERLQKLCGTSLLTEVTAVGFWTFADGIPIPTSFGDEDVDVVLGLPGLEEFSADWSKLTDVGVLRLASLKYLRELRIADADVGDESLVLLGRKPNLRVIDVSNAKRVTDVGVAALEQCDELVELNLAGTGVTSGCLPTIRRLRKLRELSLSKTEVREGLRQLSVLRDLRVLRLAGLGTAGSTVPAHELEFISSLKHLTAVSLDGTATRRLTLQDLPNLSYLTLGHETLEALALTDLPKLRSLRITSHYGEPPLTLNRLRVRDLRNVTWLAVQGLTPQASDGLARGLGTMPRINALYLKPVMTDALAAAIGDLEHLQTLGIAAIDVTDTQLAKIAKAPKLSFLRAGGQSLTSTGLRELHRAHNLSRLQLEDMALDQPDFLEALPSVTSLRMDRCRIGSLHLSGSVSLLGLDIRQGEIGKLTANGSKPFERLSISESQIQSLRVDSCRSFASLFCGSDASIDEVHLRDLPAFGAVTFQEGTRLGKLSLNNLPALKSVSFWAANVQTQHVVALQGLPALKQLDLSATGLGNEAAAAVAKLATLEDLSSSASFGLAGLKALTELPALRKLQLYHGKRSDWTPEEARRLFSHVGDVSVFGR